MTDKCEDEPGPKLMIVRYYQDEPVQWECSACGEHFSAFSVPGVYVRFRDILELFQQHCSAKHSGN